MHEENSNEAAGAMLDCLTLDPYSLKAHLALGKFLARQRRWPEARPHLEFVMRFFPDEDAEIYPLLIQTDQSLGDASAARKAARFGLRMFPGNPELKSLNLPQPKPAFLSWLK